MPFSGQKVAEKLRIKAIKAKDFFAYVYPERNGNASFSDIIKNDNPKAETIERIADLLDCSIDELFDRAPAAGKSGDHIEATDNSTAFKGINTCDPRLLSMIETRDRQIDKCQQQIDQLIELAKRA